MAGREFVSVVGKAKTSASHANYCTTERIWKSLCLIAVPSRRFFHYSNSLMQGSVRAIGDLMQGVWRSLPLVANPWLLSRR
jgi:hypothetical protein